jgi:hypothetical protein
MTRSVLLLALAILIPAGEARADWAQDSNSPLIVGSAPYDVATADFDGNGRPDVASANGDAQTMSVYLRKLAGGFVRETPDLPAPGASAIVAGDFNGDALPDVAIAGSGAQVRLRNPSGIGFADPINLGGAGVKSIATADLNRDGRLDLVFGTTGGTVYRALNVHVEDDDPVFGAPVAVTTSGFKITIAVGEFTGDGRPDVVATNDTKGDFDLLVQQADGTFLPAAKSPFDAGDRAIGLAVADFNKDGKHDVATGDYTNDAVLVRSGLGNGDFGPPASLPAGNGPAGIEAADFNFDGRFDLAIADQGGGTVTVLRRTATGFAPDPSSPVITGLAATGIASADFNVDRRLDLVVGNIPAGTPTSSLSILLNVTPFPPPPPPPPPPDLDVDNDGVQRPTDCDDSNPAVHPGAVDVPGDGIDQDCVGGDAAIPVLKRTIAYELGYGKAFTIFSSLRVKPGRKGDTIRFACKGDGCKRKKAKVKVKKNRASVSLTRFVKDARLKPGTKLEIRVTRPATVGRFRRFTIRSNKPPKQTRRCLVPGSSKPVKCG